MSIKTLIVIAGPTAIGKTALAIQLAEYYHTEIISADSRQFYKEMDIGTAKPSKEELAAAPHHFIDSLSIHENYTVGDYEKEAIKLLQKLFLTHNQVILVGGSGLFINAVCNGFDDLPQVSEEIRSHINNVFSQKGIEYLQQRLKEVDPDYYHEVDINNPQRIIRALEVFESTGKRFSEYRTRIAKKRPFNIAKIGLNTDRKKLYDRINNRVNQMISDGLVEEVEKLKSFRTANALNTVGYSEILNYFDGNFTFGEAIDKIKQNTRRFAKRQLTWFNKSKDIKWFDPNDISKIIIYLDQQIQYPEPGEQKS
ncbi:tRNA (adenosine(37)-N6)-dimethylallyltransferase MiaA [Daejeonella oryzae]|uniref:tRNA (adenosine(37)-N6)-dimethylallyltransferase MiaA n=1 Tax=Daejeonella oryzae TaxID=1122943 RepID=UPI000412CD92|nr:tRNA (adenosine(37)-N6)-dimethylallyltransferase MiaA [Daejeonella oryzae]